MILRVARMVYAEAEGGELRGSPLSISIWEVESRAEQKPGVLSPLLINYSNFNIAEAVIGGAPILEAAEGKRYWIRKQPDSFFYYLRNNFLG